MPALPPVYVISLPGSTRRQGVQAAFDGIGLPFRFWDGVNGAELDAGTLAEIDDAYTLSEWGHGLSKGEIGCALSHIRLYEHLVAERHASAIVLEDDARPVEGFMDVLRAMLASLPSRAELAFIHHGKAKSWPLGRSLAHGHRLVRYRYPSAGSKRTIISARGYWLSLAGAHRLLAHAYPVRMPADYLTGYIQRSRIKAYGVEPNLLQENDLPSEIDSLGKRNYGGHVGEHV